MAVVTPEQLDEIVRRLAAALDPEAIYLFGSQAANCLACGRCFAYCPREQVRRKRDLKRRERR